MPSRAGDPAKRGQARLSAMFKYKVQVANSASEWKTIYSSETDNIRIAEADAKRQVEWVADNLAQYGEPVAVRAVIAGEHRFQRSFWTAYA